MKENIRIATLNTRGMKKTGFREEVDIWMKDEGINILMLQEAHIETSHRETRKDTTWYFSGEEGHVNAGVAMVIDNDYKQYVRAVKPVNPRIMSMETKGKPGLMLISAYAPPGTTKDKRTKTAFYKALEK